jgi:hypothetical protein
MVGCWKTELTTMTTAKRLNKIEMWAVDPFDNTQLCGALLAYDKRLSAKGFYTKSYQRISKAARFACGHILQGRQPKVTVKYHFA